MSVGGDGSVQEGATRICFGGGKQVEKGEKYFIDKVARRRYRPRFA